MINMRKRRIFIVILGLLLLPFLPVADYQQHLNERLFRAISTDNLNATLAALKQGADPNARCATIEFTRIPPPFFLWQYGKYRYTLWCDWSGRWKPLWESEQTRGYVTPIIVASQQKERNLAIIQALVAHGARVNDTGIWNMSALQMASGSADIKVMKVLLDAGADVNQESSYGNTPLMCAVGSQNMDAVRFLVEHGADLSFKDKAHEDALQVAKHQVYSLHWPDHRAYNPDEPLTKDELKQIEKAQEIVAYLSRSAQLQKESK